MYTLVGDEVQSIEQFMTQYRMDNPAVLHRIKVSVLATVEHASEAGPETAKQVAETTQYFITFMDALHLNLRTKEELHPLLRDLVTSCSKFKGHKDSEGRSKMVSWLIMLNGMQISERLSDEQARQLLFDIEHAYMSFSKVLWSRWSLRLIRNPAFSSLPPPPTMTTKETPLLQNSHDAVYDWFPSGRKKVLIFIVSLGALVTCKYIALTMLGRADPLDAFVSVFTSGTFIPTIPQIVEELDSTKEIISIAVTQLASICSQMPLAVSSQYNIQASTRRSSTDLIVVVSCHDHQFHRRCQCSKRDVAHGLAIHTSSRIISRPFVGVGVIGDVYKLEERGTALGIYLCRLLQSEELWHTIGLGEQSMSPLLHFAVQHEGPRYEWSGKVSSKVWPVMLNPLEQLALLRSPNILVAAFLNYTGMLTDFDCTQKPGVNTMELRTKRCWERAFSLLAWAKQQGDPITHIDPVGAPLAGWISDKVVVKYKKKRGYWYLEDCLRASMFSCYLPLCVLGSALITKYVPGRLGLTLNLICLFLNSVGCDIALTPYGTYIVNILHSKSAEVTAAVNTFCMIAVAGSTAVMLPMIDAYGYLFTSLVVAIVATAGLGLTIVTIAHGEAMRRWVDVGFSTAENN
ncbi:hypothetical protein D9756_008846 [Leucocoprinus leucothites]|uniref:Uncharacterized protein n=1 Tax=Leucocoprinus leucothites TaxID=201217 RepID=A0A8H5CX33_9AGAR|nr:hypothetical protein D9756_008846 [Leucoagaricus leucothites]